MAYSRDLAVLNYIILHLQFNVLELPKNHFKNVKKVADFPYVRGGGGGFNQHMENSICFLQILFESFPYLYCQLQPHMVLGPPKK